MCCLRHFAPKHLSSLDVLGENSQLLKRGGSGEEIRAVLTRKNGAVGQEGERERQQAVISENNVCACGTSCWMGDGVQVSSLISAGHSWAGYFQVGK